MTNDERNRKTKNSNDRARPGVKRGEHAPAPQRGENEIPRREGERPPGDDGTNPPTYEIPSRNPAPEIPEKPSRDIPQPDRERAENEGMSAPPAESSNPKENRRFNA